MAQYVVFDENVEVRGLTIQATLEAMGQSGYEALARHGIEDVQSDGWYSQVAYLNAFKELAEDGLLNMVAVGMGVPDLVEWPPEITTVEQALGALDAAYHMNHRGGDIGSYEFVSTGEREGKVVCNNPYPSDFDYGLIYRIVQKFRPDEGRVMRVIRDEEMQNRTEGGEECVYYLKW